MLTPCSPRVPGCVRPHAERRASSGTEHLQLLQCTCGTAAVEACTCSHPLPPLSRAPTYQGEFDDFTTKWYIVVASSLTLTMFLNTFTAHAPILAKKFLILPLKRKLLLNSRVTQRQLNLL